MSQLPSSALDVYTAALQEADAREGDGAMLEAIDALTRANRARPEPGVESRLVAVRHRAFELLDRTSGFSSWPPVAPGGPENDGTVPAVVPAELTAEVVRHHITTHGCLRVRGVADANTTREFVDGIDRALAEWRGLRRPYAKATGSPWFDPLEVDDPSRAGLGRTWVTNSGGLLTADSPRNLFRLLEVFEDAGLRDVVTGYLGERPALSANKCTLRKVPVETDAGWHQDGAFLGRGIRALNIWLALTPCGRDAPGLDLVPRRLDHIVETGTRGAYFDWAVGADLVAELAQETPVLRPEFDAGDVLIFDDLFLHRTGVDPTMTRHRYAIETWCFAPSAYPEGHVPIVW